MAKNTIKVKSYLDVQDEALANAALNAGHLVERMSTGKVRKHATAGGRAYPMYAMEDHNQGWDIADAYAENELVKLWIPTRGDRVYARISATSEAIAIGDFLESAGDGTLRKADVASSSAVIEQVSSIVAVGVEAIAAGGQGVVESM